MSLFIDEEKNINKNIFDKNMLKVEDLQTEAKSAKFLKKINKKKKIDLTETIN